MIEEDLFFEDDNDIMKYNKEENDEDYYAFFQTKISTEDITEVNEDEMMHSPSTKSSTMFTVQKEKNKKKNNKENLIGNKMKRENGESQKETKKYKIVNDKVVLLTNKLTQRERKEIKMLRNKLSAQKSRDKGKEEFSQISKENEELKKIISQKNEIIEKQNKIIASCDRCSRARNEITQSNGITSIFKLTSALGVICLIGVIALCLFGANTERKGQRVLEEKKENYFLAQEKKLFEGNNLLRSFGKNILKNYASFLNTTSLNEYSYSNFQTPSFDYDINALRRNPFLVEIGCKAIRNFHIIE